MNSSTRGFLAVIMGLALAGCGGGGGGGGGSSTADQYDGNTKPVAITTKASADAVVSNGTAALFDMTIGSPLAKATASTRPMAQAKALVDKYLPKPGFQPNPAFREDPCDDGGSITYNETDTTITVSYNDCIVGSSRMNGSMVLVLKEQSDNGSVQSATVAVAINALRLEQLGTTNYAYMDGDYTYHFNYDYAGTNVVTFRQTSTAMYYDEKYNGARYESLLQDVDTTYSFDYDSNLERYNVNFTVTSTELGGSVTVDTTETFVWPSGSTYPTAGQVIFSSGDARVRVTVQAGDVLLVEYDLDGDGTWEETATTTW